MTAKWHIKCLRELTAALRKHTVLKRKLIGYNDPWYQLLFLLFAWMKQLELENHLQFISGSNH